MREEEGHTMKPCFYAKSPGNEGYIKNMEVLAFHDLDGWAIFQMALYRKEGRYYLYGAGRGNPVCPILDVTDPERPKLVERLCVAPDNPRQKVGKIQAADGLLITALSCGASASGAAGAYRPEQFGTGLSGFMIFDIASDPIHPRLLGCWKNGVSGGANGVHRFFYNGGSYVHVSSDCRGFEGMIYRIVDIRDPTAPREVGRWWLPEQFADGYAGRTFDPCAPHNPEYMKKGWLHGPPYVRDGRAYCGYAGAGLVVLDVRDVTRPKLLGRLPLSPPFSSYYAGAKTHTALPLPGRDFLVLTNEGERFPWFNAEKLGGMPQSLNNLHLVDIRDPSRPTLIAEFPYPEVPEGFPYPNFNEMGIGCPGPFGPHNIYEPMSNKPWLEQRGDRVYCCYFHAGLRVYDVSAPYYVKEIGYFIPPNPLRHRVSTNVGPCIGVSEDCVVDDRGVIFMDTYQDGLYVLRMQ